MYAVSISSPSARSEAKDRTLNRQGTRATAVPRRIGIVGAGPAGIMAALEAARLGAHVLLFDSNAVVGRKILVTGNGRCNISNRNAAPARYHCADPTFLETALGLFGHPETIARLNELGIPTHATPDGWCYPLSDSAATVAETLGAMLELAGVEVHLNAKMIGLQMDGEGMQLLGADAHAYAVDRAIVATGGKASPKLGSRGEFFKVLRSLGHTITPVHPALAPIEADVRPFHKLQGVRLDVGLTLFEGEHILGEAVGNMMFTQYGFSGPAAMDLSHLVSARPGADLHLSIDLLPHTRDTLTDLLSRLRGKPVPLRVLLGSVLPPKIPGVILPMVGLAVDVRLGDVSAAHLDALLRLMGRLTARVTGTRGFEFVQLSSGGVPVSEVEPRRMASRVMPGLHLAGEVLDVIGPCGGYNLQFAFTSGALAGRGAAE